MLTSLVVRLWWLEERKEAPLRSLFNAQFGSPHSRQSGTSEKLDKKTIELRWPVQDTASPDDIIGKRVVVKLEEDRYKRNFTATIEGYKTKEGVPDDTWYVFRVDNEAARDLGVSNLLFHPEWIDDPRFHRELRKGLKQGIAYTYRASMEELLLDPKSPFASVSGRVYKILNPDVLLKATFQHSDISVFARAHVAKMNE